MTHFKTQCHWQQLATTVLFVEYNGNTNKEGTAMHNTSIVHSHSICNTITVTMSVNHDNIGSTNNSDCISRFKCAFYSNIIHSNITTLIHNHSSNHSNAHSQYSRQTQQHVYHHIMRASYNNMYKLSNAPRKLNIEIEDG